MDKNSLERGCFRIQDSCDVRRNYYSHVWLSRCMEHPGKTADGQESTGHRDFALTRPTVLEPYKSVVRALVQFPRCKASTQRALSACWSKTAGGKLVDLAKKTRLLPCPENSLVILPRKPACYLSKKTRLLPCPENSPVTLPRKLASYLPQKTHLLP